MSFTDLSIIVLNWNVAPLVGELLESIARETHGISYEIFVADNASKDEIERVVGQFRSRHPRVTLTFLRHPRNLGFAAGNNPAIRLAKGRTVVLLNPDARVKGGALQKMVAWMDAHPDVGVAGPKLLNPDGTLQPSVRRLPGLLDQALILLKFPHLSLFPAPLRRYFATDFDYGREQDVEQIMGAAFFVRRDVFEKIGLLDERFFIWFEEVDFCKRARDAGFRVVYTPAAQVVHHGGASFAKQMTWRKQFLFTESMSKYFNKHRGGWTAIVLALPVFIGLLSAAAYSLWKHPHSRR